MSGVVGPTHVANIVSGAGDKTSRVKCAKSIPAEEVPANNPTVSTLDMYRQQWKSFSLALLVSRLRSRQACIMRCRMTYFLKEICCVVSGLNNIRVDS